MKINKYFVYQPKAIWHEEENTHKDTIKKENFTAGNDIQNVN